MDLKTPYTRNQATRITELAEFVSLSEFEIDCQLHKFEKLYREYNE